MYLNGLVVFICLGLARTAVEENVEKALTNEPNKEFVEGNSHVARDLREPSVFSVINGKHEERNKMKTYDQEGAGKTEGEDDRNDMVNLVEIEQFNEISSQHYDDSEGMVNKNTLLNLSQMETDASSTYERMNTSMDERSQETTVIDPDPLLFLATNSNAMINSPKEFDSRNHDLVNESEELWPQHQTLRIVLRSARDEFSLLKNDSRPYFVKSHLTQSPTAETVDSVDNFAKQSEKFALRDAENSSPIKPFEVRYLTDIYDSQFSENIIDVDMPQIGNDDSQLKRYSMVSKKGKNRLNTVDGIVPKNRLHLYKAENNLPTKEHSRTSQNVFEFQETSGKPKTKADFINIIERINVANENLDGSPNIDNSKSEVKFLDVSETEHHDRMKRSVLDSEEDIWQNNLSSRHKRQRRRQSSHHHSRVVRQQIKDRKLRNNLSNINDKRKRVSRMSKKQGTSNRNDHGVQLFSRWSRWTRCNRRCKQKRRRRCKKKQLCGSALIKEERSCFGWRCKKKPSKTEEDLIQTDIVHPDHREVMDSQLSKSTQKYQTASENSISTETSNKMSSGDDNGIRYVNREQKIFVGSNRVQPHRQSSRHHHQHHNHHHHHRPTALEEISLEANNKPPVFQSSSEDEHAKSETRRPFKVVQGRKSSHRDLRLLLNFNAVFYTRWSDWGECSNTCLTSRYRWCKYRLFCGGAIVREEAYCYIPGDECETKYKEENGDVTVQEYLTSSVEEKPSKELGRNDWDGTHYELFSNEHDGGSRNGRKPNFMNDKNELLNFNSRDPFSSRWPDSSFPWEDYINSHDSGRSKGRLSSHREVHGSQATTGDVSRNRYNIVSSGQPREALDTLESISFNEKNDIFRDRDRDREAWHRRRETSDLLQEDRNHSNGQTSHHRRRYPAHRDSTTDLSDEAEKSDLFAAKVSSSSFAFSPSHESTHSSSSSSASSSGLMSMSSSSSSGQSAPSVAQASSGFLPFSSSKRNSSFSASPRLTHFPSTLLSSLAGFGKSSILDSQSLTSSSSSTSSEQYSSYAAAGRLPTLLEDPSSVSGIQDSHRYNLGRDEKNEVGGSEEDATSVELFGSDEAVNLGSPENHSSDILFDLVPLGSPRPPPSSLSSHLSSFFLSQTDSVDPSPTSPTPSPSLHSPNLNAVCGVSTKGLWADGKGHNATRAAEDRRKSYGLKKAGLSLKILGGREAERGQWPWQVVILNRYREAFCGGVVVGPRWVLTAAHCVRKRLYARLAEHDLAVSEGTELEFRVSESISHPLYDSTTVDNDVALLRLPQPLDYTPYLSPVCLPEQGAHLPVGEVCTIIGWGKERHTHLFGTDVLHQAEVPIIPSASCRAVYKDYYITPNMFCAGYRGGRVDSCAGDSGGPLLCRQGQKWHVVGITSFGEGCGRRGKYGIYARVSNYRSWIRDVMSAHEHRSRGHQRKSRSPDSTWSSRARGAGWTRP
ncbi:Serine proteases trypsin domain [Trinorchestia longiramus]|nr:Serine proteases trypsin domain [Trinorchestia longiramus]